MGVTLASFYSDGVTPVEIIVRLTRYLIGLAITGAVFLKSLAVRPSSPAALANLSLSVLSSQRHLKIFEARSSSNPGSPKFGHRFTLIIAT